MDFQIYLDYIDHSLAVNVLVLLLALFICYRVAYRTRFVEWFFSDVIVPQFTRINKRYVRFTLYKDQYKSIGLERYHHAFMFGFLPVSIIGVKSISIGLLYFGVGEGYEEWDFLTFFVLISPVMMLFHGSNLQHLKMGLIIGLFLGAAVYGFNNYGEEYLGADSISDMEEFTIEFGNLSADVENLTGAELNFTDQSGDYEFRLGPRLIQNGKLFITWNFALYAGLLLIFSFQLVKSYAGNYNFLKYHRVFQNASRTTIFGKKVSFVQVLINKILNLYLWLMPFVMLNSLAGIALGNYSSGGPLAEYVLPRMEGIIGEGTFLEILLTNLLTLYIFIFIGLVALPLSKGMFQYKIFKVLGNFQDIVEEEKSDENIIKGYMNYLGEFSDVSSLGDLIMFILIFDTVLGFFVEFSDIFTFPFLSQNDIILLSAILKVEVYTCILLSILRYKEEKKGTDFFDMIQESFRGDYIDLKFFRLGSVAGFKQKKYMKYNKQMSKQEVVENIHVLMAMYRYELALKLTEKLYKRDKKDPEVQRLLLRCYDSLGWNVKFNSLVKKLIKKFGDTDYNLHLAHGRYYFYLQNYPWAVESLQRCLLINPRCEEAHFYMGRSQIEIEDYVKANDSFEQVYRLNPKNFVNLYYYGLTSLHSQDYVQSMRLLREAIEADINHLNVWELLGDNYLRLGKEKEAAQCFTLVLESENEHMYLTRARAYQIIGDNEKFREHLEMAEEDLSNRIFGALQNFRHSDIYHDIKAQFEDPTIQKRPSEELPQNVALRLGEIYDHRDLEVDISSLEEGVAYVRLRGLLTGEADRKDKRQVLRKYKLQKKMDAIRELGSGFLDLGDIEFLRGNMLSAIYYYRIAERIYLKEAEFKFTDFVGFEDIVYRRIGDVLTRLGHFDQAVEAHLKSLEINGDQSVEYFKAGLNYYLASFDMEFPLQEASALSSAISFFSRAIRVSRPRLQNPYFRYLYVLSAYFRGKAMEVMNGFDKASTYLESVSEEMESYNSLWLALAEAYVYYEKEVWETNEEGRYILKYTTDKGKYYDRAREVLGQVLKQDPTNQEARRLMEMVEN